MRNHKVIEIEAGVYAIGYGKRYYTDTMTHSKKQAKIMCLSYRVGEAQSMMDALEEEYENLDRDEIQKWAGHNKHEFRDLLA